MLILSRYQGQKIIIGRGENKITVLVHLLDREKGYVKIGIDAPKGLSVDREEIYERKLKTLRSAHARPIEKSN